MCYCFINKDKYQNLYDVSEISEQSNITSNNFTNPNEIILSNFSVTQINESRIHVSYRNPTTNEKIASFYLSGSELKNNMVYPKELVNVCDYIEIFLDDDGSHVIELKKLFEKIDDFIECEAKQKLLSSENNNGNSKMDLVEDNMQTEISLKRKAEFDCLENQNKKQKLDDSFID